MAAVVWEDLFDLSRAQLLLGGAALLLYGALALLAEMGQWQKLGFGFLAALYLAVVLGQRRLWKSGHRQTAARLLSGGLAAALTLAQLGYTMNRDAESVHTAYRNGRFARQMPAVIAE